MIRTRRLINPPMLVYVNGSYSPCGKPTGLVAADCPIMLPGFPKGHVHSTNMPSAPRRTYSSRKVNRIRFGMASTEYDVLPRPKASSCRMLHTDRCQANPVETRSTGYRAPAAKCPRTPLTTKFASARPGRSEGWQGMRTNRRTCWRCSDWTRSKVRRGPGAAISRTCRHIREPPVPVGRQRRRKLMRAWCGCRTGAACCGCRHVLPARRPAVRCLGAADWKREYSPCPPNPGNR